MKLGTLGSSWNLNGADEKGSINTGNNFFYPDFHIQPSSATASSSSRPLAAVNNTTRLPLPLHREKLMNSQQQQQSSRLSFSSHRSSSHFTLPTSLSKSSLILLLFLPFPPIFALLYCFVGHAILRMKNAYTHASLLSSVQAGALGGAILALPLALLFYILLFPSKRPDPEDFFEDDMSQMTRVRVQRYTKIATYASCGAVAVLLGTISGPLGVVCLGGFRLSSTQAAAAGTVGGVVICVGAAVLGVLTVGIWVLVRSYRGRGKTPEEEEGRD